MLILIKKSRSIFTHVFVFVVFHNELVIVLCSNFRASEIYDNISQCHSSNLTFQVSHARVERLKTHILNKLFTHLLRFFCKYKKFDI